MRKKTDGASLNLADSGLVTREKLIEIAPTMEFAGPPRHRTEADARRLAAAFASANTPVRS